MPLFASLTGAFFLFVAAPTRAAVTVFPVQTCAELALALAENERALKENDFPVDRGLLRRSKVDGKSYLSHMGFSRPFEQLLCELGPRQVWLDSPGSLEVFREYVESERFAPKCRLVAVGISYPTTLRTSENLEFLRALGPRFRSFVGAPLETLDTDEVGRVHLSSDLFGPLTFTAEIDKALETYGKLLVRGGYLVAQFRKVFIRTPEGRVVGRDKYLRMIDGFELISSSWGAVVLRKTKNSVKAPKLRLVGFLPFNDALGRIYPERYYLLE